MLFDDASPVFRHVQRHGAASVKKNQSANEQVSCFLDHILTDLFSASAYPLNVRFSYLARLLAEIIALSESKQLSNQVLAKFTDKHHENLKGFAEAFSAGRFASRPANGVHMWDLLRAGAERFNLFQACGLAEPLPIMKLARQAITDNDAKQLFYQELMALRSSAGPQLGRYEKALECYLQCRFMAQGFPLFLQQHPVASFLASFLPFTITQMLVWIKASESPLTDDDIVDAVIRVEEILFHSDALLQTLAKNQFLLNIGGYFDWFLEVN